VATVRRGWPAAGAPRAFGLLARKRFPADAGAREQHGEGTTLLSTQHAARSRAASQMIVLLTVLSEKKAIVVTRGVLLMPLAHAPVPSLPGHPHASSRRRCSLRHSAHASSQSFCRLACGCRRAINRHLTPPNARIPLVGGGGKHRPATA